MKINGKWLKDKQAWSDIMEWFNNNIGIKHGEIEAVELIEKLIAEDKLGWANWLIVRVMTRPQYLAYAIYAGELVLPIYEAAHPNEKRPRGAVEAARRVLIDDTDANREAAGKAADAAADAAWEATSNAWATKVATVAAGGMYAQVEYAVLNAAWMVRKATQEIGSCENTLARLLRYGIGLLTEKEAKNENI
jgi:hypothetical protein